MSYVQLRHRPWFVALAACCLLGTLSGCAGEEPAQASARPGSLTQAAPGGGSSASPTTSAAGPEVTTNARDGLAAGTALKVSALGGTLVNVTVESQYGTVQGRTNTSGTEWTSTAERAPRTQYHITATATNAAKGMTTFDRTFTTGASPRALTADVTPWGDQVVGIGQPIVVQLSSPVTGRAARAAVEKALVVSADKAIGPASWYWWSSTQLHYRPRDFWPTHTKVQVAVNLAGVHAGKGLWGAKDRTVTFSIGRSFVMEISNAKHRMTVKADGRVVRTIPVSMGRSGYETRSGIKTIMSHDKTVRMTSASYGGKDFYDEIVHYAQRLTWSGEFIHSAPWSVGAQGRSNVSHGCVNISPSNAIWLFGKTLIGDPVITTGTSRQMEPGNGTGGDWDLSWSKWLAGSALN